MNTWCSSARQSPNRPALANVKVLKRSPIHFTPIKELTVWLASLSRTVTTWLWLHISFSRTVDELLAKYVPWNEHSETNGISNMAACQKRLLLVYRNPAASFLLSNISAPAFLSSIPLLICIYSVRETMLLLPQCLICSCYGYPCQRKYPLLQGVHLFLLVDSMSYSQHSFKVSSLPWYNPNPLLFGQLSYYSTRRSWYSWAHRSRGQ